MNRWSLVVLVLASMLGCRSRDRVPESSDRVNVDVPFVNVRVGEQGGAKVDAPFTHIETPRYQQQGYVQQQPVTVPAQPVSQGNYQQMPTSQSYRPISPVSPNGAAASPRRIPPAAGVSP